MTVRFMELVAYLVTKHVVLVMVHDDLQLYTGKTGPKKKCSSD